MEFYSQQSGLLAVGEVAEDPSTWKASFDSFTLTNGEYSIYAKASYYMEGNYGTCDSSVVGVKINNQNETVVQSNEKLALYLNPFYWEGPVNTNAKFSVTAMLESAGNPSRDVTPATSFVWSSSIGQIEGAQNLGNYRSGNIAGVGLIKIHASYQDKAIVGVINIKVLTNSTQTTTATSNYSGDGNTAKNSATSTIVPQTASEIAKAIPDAETTQCFETVLGKEKYAKFIAGDSKPTASELKSVWACIEKNNYVVPNYLAPVKPAEVSKLTKNAGIKIDKVSNGTSKKTDGSDQTVLVLSGKATPNANLLIYIFSDPLVLAAKSDADGNWSYQLENPLEPGQHQAYVAIDDGNNDYSVSEPIVFDIARAASSSNNPQGASLLLVSDQPLWQNYYIWYAGGFVAIALAFMYLFIKRKAKKAATIENVT